MDAIEQVKQKLYEKYCPEIDKDTPASIVIAHNKNKGLIDTSILYVQKKLAEKKEENGKWVAKNNYAADFLLQSIAECVDNDFALDGINYTLTGNRMYMPTYKAFKNKLYMVYPDTVIDLQLIRDGDTYSFAKESGAVVYQHNIGDPFESKQRNIIGAYCVIKNKRGEFLETLNQEDYQKMRDGSKNPKLWDKWESEFWLKSVIKRACKRHFNDITAAIEEKDNEVVGLADIVKATPTKKKSIIAAKKAKAAPKPKEQQDDGNSDT